ncbi:MAG TPA: flagellar cap protein FliD N-terminal domain-containing protein, partial [Planctomycetota bacterium]|nr:flagellar cap protein FliD N-terminal domain-containing protein [Planctomycetota bacterium]
MSGLTSVDGIISGLKTTEIIDSIMAVERRPVTLLEAKNERYNTEFLSYQSM